MKKQGWQRQEEESPPKVSREEIAALKEELQAAKQETSRLSNELDAAREKYLSLRKQQEEITNTLLESMKRRAEKAENELAAIKEETEKETQIGHDRIAELEQRVEEMQAELLIRQEKIVEKNTELDRLRSEMTAYKNLAETQCAEKEREVMSVKSSNDKMYALVHTKELEIKEQRQTIHDIRSEKAAAEETVTDIQSRVSALSKELLKVVQGLNECVPQEKQCEEVPATLQQKPPTPIPLSPAPLPLPLRPAEPSTAEAAERIGIGHWLSQKICAFLA